MKHDFDNLDEGPRLERRLKKKKYNRVLNLLIVIVAILVFYFGSQLFFSNDKNAKATNDNKQTYTDKTNTSHKTAKGEKKTKTVDKSDNKKDEDKNKDNEENDASNVIVEEGSADSNVLNTIVNPSWQPVGTVQAEPHVPNYKQNSVDWDEMIKAVNYATGLTESNYTLWWIGRNGDNQSAITIENNDDHKLYRIYIGWIDNEGWKPLKIEELKENDSPANNGH